MQCRSSSTGWLRLRREHQCSCWLDAASNQPALQLAAAAVPPGQLESVQSLLNGHFWLQCCCEFCGAASLPQDGGSCCCPGLSHARRALSSPNQPTGSSEQQQGCNYRRCSAWNCSKRCIWAGDRLSMQRRPCSSASKGRIASGPLCVAPSADSRNSTALPARSVW